jgi:hypothetical protein
MASAAAASVAARQVEGQHAGQLLLQQVEQVVVRPC